MFFWAEQQLAPVIIRRLHLVKKAWGMGRIDSGAQRQNLTFPKLNETSFLNPYFIKHKVVHLYQFWKEISQLKISLLAHVGAWSAELTLKHLKFKLCTSICHLQIHIWPAAPLLSLGRHYVPKLHLTDDGASACTHKSLAIQPTRSSDLLPFA